MRKLLEIVKKVKHSKTREIITKKKPIRWNLKLFFM